VAADSAAKALVENKYLFINQSLNTLKVGEAVGGGGDQR